MARFTIILFLCFCSLFVYTQHSNKVKAGINKESETEPDQPCSLSIKVASLIQPDCSKKNGIINITIENGISPISYIWNDGTKTLDRSNLTNGSYSITVVDGNNCKQTADFLIDTIALNPPQICTVKEIKDGTQAKIIWKNNISAHVINIAIYKQMNNIRDRIAVINPLEKNYYIDKEYSADERIIYQLRSIDSCGNESPLSLPVSPIKLTLSQIDEANVSIQWEGTENHTIEELVLQKHIKLENEFSQYQLQQHEYSYIDDETVKGETEYILTYKIDASCIDNSTHKKSEQWFKTNSAVLSMNEAVTSPEGGVEFKVYPNPVIDYFSIKSKERGMIQATIYTANYQTIFSQGIYAGKKINISFLPAGIYYLELEVGERSSVQMIIKK